MTFHADHSMLRLFVRETETIGNEKLFDAIINFLKRENIFLNVFFQKNNASIDENYSITTDSIEVLSYGAYLTVTFVGETDDIEKLSGWLKNNCNDGIIAIEKPGIVFLNKLRNLISAQKLTAAKIMKRDVVCVNESASVTEVIRLIYESKIRFLPVLDEKTGCVKGVITEGDLIKSSLLPLKTKLFGTHDLDMAEFGELIENLKRHGHIIAFDVMRSGPVYSVPPDAGLKDIIFTMNKYRLKRIMVVENGQKPVGIISRFDIFKAVVSAVSSTAPTAEAAAEINAAGESDLSRPQQKECPAGDIKKFIDCGYKAITMNTRLDKIIEKIDASEFTFIPVIDEYRILKGIITDRELFSFKPEPSPEQNIFKKIYNVFFKKSADARLGLNLNLTAGDIMKEARYLCTKENASFVETLNRMINENLKMIIVVDEKFEYKGIVSRRNIIRNIIN